MSLNKHIDNNRGASSVLVIIMMVVLLVFGLAVLTTSLSNVRLGERKKAWLAEYYLLEGEAEIQVAGFDALLMEAEAETIDYLATDAYMEDYMLDGPLTGPLKQQVFALAYSDFVMEKLSQAIMGREDAAYYHNGLTFEELTNGSVLESSRLEFSVKLPNSQYDKNIQITMVILTPENGNLTDEMAIAERYIITRHTQQQEAFEYDESIDFEDPFEE